MTLDTRKPLFIKKKNVGVSFLDNSRPSFTFFGFEEILSEIDVPNLVFSCSLGKSKFDAVLHDCLQFVH